MLTDFTSPWDSVAVSATSFKALWDSNWLYCLYRVKDDSVFTPVAANGRKGAGESDRVEIFFKSDDKMNPYYCLELDAEARVLDYQAAWYHKMNYAWQWPKDQLIIKSSRTGDGCIVEFAISIQSIKHLGLVQHNRLQAGLFRGECSAIIHGRGVFIWITWVKPHSAIPDFHIPQAFGVLALE